MNMKIKIFMTLLIVFLFVVPTTIYAITRTIKDDEEDLYEFIRANDRFFATTEAGLQSAIDSLTHGGEVKIPANTSITLTGVIDAVADITIIGGGYSTVLNLNAAVNMIEVVGVENIIIEKIRFEHNHLAHAGYTACISIGGDSTFPPASEFARNVTIRDCWFYNGSGSMITIWEWGADVWIEDCIFMEREDTGWGGAVFVRSWNRTTIKNCYMEDTYATGVAIESSPGYWRAGQVTVDGCYFTGDIGYAIAMEGDKSDNCTFVNNVFKDTDGDAYGANTARGILGQDNSTFINNRLYGVERMGIYVGNNNVIIGNHVYDININSGIVVGDNNTVTANVIYNYYKGGANTPAIGISCGVDNTIEANIIHAYGVAEFDIAIESNYGNTIRGNKITKCSTGIRATDEGKNTIISFNTIAESDYEAIVLIRQNFSIVSFNNIDGALRGIRINRSFNGTFSCNIIDASTNNRAIYEEADVVTPPDYNTIILNNLRQSPGTVAVVGTHTIVNASSNGLTDWNWY